MSTKSTFFYSLTEIPPICPFSSPVVEPEIVNSSALESYLLSLLRVHKKWPGKSKRQQQLNGARESLADKRSGDKKTRDDTNQVAVTLLTIGMLAAVAAPLSHQLHSWTVSSFTVVVMSGFMCFDA